MRAVLRVMFCLAVAAALACERAPDELQFVVGKVVTAEGAPLVGHEVRLERNANFRCTSLSFPGAAFEGIDGGAFVSEGTFASNEHGDFLFEQTHRATEADDGDLPGMKACFQVVVEDVGGTSTTSFLFGEGDVELADLPVQRARPTLEQADGGIVLDSKERIDLSGYTASATQWTLRSNETLVWPETAEGRAYLAPELAEDFPGLNVFREAHAIFEPDSAPISFQTAFSSQLTLYSPVLEVPRSPSQVRVPLSRGATCEPALPDGGVCPLTDGRAEAVSFLLAPDPDGGISRPPPDTLQIDLGMPQSIQSLVIRGLNFESPVDDLFVEVSADGQTWARAASFGAFPYPTDSAGWTRVTLDSNRLDGFYAFVPLQTSGPQRFVRVRGQRGVPPMSTGVEPGPLRFFRAREISVF